MRRLGPTQNGTIVLKDFKFGSGQTLPESKLHYLALGTPHRNGAGRVDNAVLLLHGTGGNAHSLLNPVFSDVLFVQGGLLDITKYFLILPDEIGHGESSKPSNGMHAHFPTKDALYESAVLRRFTGADLGRAAAPDESHRTELLSSAGAA